MKVYTVKLEWMYFCAWAAEVRAMMRTLERDLALQPDAINDLIYATCAELLRRMVPKLLLKREVVRFKLTLSECIALRELVGWEGWDVTSVSLLQDIDQNVLASLPRMRKQLLP